MVAFAPNLVTRPPSCHPRIAPNQNRTWPAYGYSPHLKLTDISLSRSIRNVYRIATIRRYRQPVHRFLAHVARPQITQELPRVGRLLPRLFSVSLRETAFAIQPTTNADQIFVVESGVDSERLPVDPRHPDPEQSREVPAEDDQYRGVSPTSESGKPLIHRIVRLGDPGHPLIRHSKASSLLNGGEGKIATAADAREHDASPPHSRSSSAQGSYSTSATTFEDGDEATGTAKTSSKAKEVKGNVIVSVRVRPDANGSDGAKASGEWIVDGRRGLISHHGKEAGDYYYDNVFTAHEHNSRVYDSAAKRLVRRVMEGYHGTVFAYGMTGTGKTFSMQGTATAPGVIPLAITDIFSFIRETPHREFLLRVSYLEIYNEKIHDLLSASTSGGTMAQQEEIKLREDSKRGVYATPLKEEIVQSPTQLLRVIARGDHARRTGSTQFNARSSRSHAVVQIVVESRERAPTGPTQDRRSGMAPGGVRVSTLSLIDLAGSERAADDKERRTEGAHINKSLLTLGNIISRLSESKDKSGAADKEGRHLPYRDSKLTRLLQPALSGNSLVSILCTIQLGSAANSHSGETLNTLKFAARAKNNIVSHAKRAEEAYGSGGGDAGSRVLLERYRMEIQALRGQLESQTKAQAEKELKLEEQQLEKEAQARHEEQMLEMQLARTALKERIEHLNRLILSSKSTGVNIQGSMSALGRLSRMSSLAESGSRSLRSSVSQSTLGAYGGMRPMSFLSVNSNDPSVFSGGPMNNDDDDMGEFADGKASAQRQIAALQADLSDKNRYISTWRDDLEINELRQQLDDKDRMLAALRSAARHREVAHINTDTYSTDGKEKSKSPEKRPSSISTPPADPDVLAPLPGETKDGQRKSMDEVSRILDEMIQDRVESGQLIKGSRGSVRIAESRRASDSVTNVPGLRTASSGTGDPDTGVDT
ncbi:hypothetical protein ATEG_02847 [Aspergillus terreus NIH2624]|uniref:Kinesin-like protein n=1 Tax=Aspergillus terreus (strain NIH 2624 / FGSC A1156) TaxID=341663 RepID=Q0CTY7_ASPTN|nr:uncharacterized protein ATEG_02847 [Aspergillus terreus NIH2624]EAU36121.1 hypothetical protein ATEG_02847 [Aspergillus terreus NIH2624]